MRYPLPREKRVLSIDPSIKGFGFAVLEGQFNLIDWGCKQAKGNKNADCLKKIEKLMEFYHPVVLVLEDCSDKGSRRRSRAKRLIKSISTLSEKRKVQVRQFSRERVRKTFSRTGTTKIEIAQAIAGYFPELGMPRRVPFYAPEPERMNIYDAISFVLTYYSNE